MEFIQPNFEIIEQEPGIEGMFKHIEKAARVCYRSEDKITDNSYKHMLEILENKGHFSPLAHGSVYLSVPTEYMPDFWKIIGSNNSFYNTIWTETSIDKSDPKMYWKYYTTNYRVIKELGLEKLLDEYWEEPNELSPKRITVKVITSSAVAKEWNRHATSLAICEESTRYCAYNKDKFGGEIKCIEPLWLKEASSETAGLYINALENAEGAYLDLLSTGITAQNARGVLPKDIATTVYYTGFVDDWKHIFDMRCSNAAHPEIRRIMIPLREEFKNRRYID